MKIFSVIVLVLSSLFVTCKVCAQDGERSSATKILQQQVVDGNHRAILQAAETGDVTLIPYLRQLSSGVTERRNNNHPAFNAHVALAKLGDLAALRAILDEVDHDSPAVQDQGLFKLSLVGGKIAFNKLYELLDDTRPRENPDCLKAFEARDENNPEDKRSAYCDVIYFARSVTAMIRLRRMVDNPPVSTFYGKKEEIDQWKRFLKENKLVD